MKPIQIADWDRSASVWEYVEKGKVCEDALTWLASLEGDITIGRVVDECPRGEWLLWLYCKRSLLSPRQRVGVVCATVRGAPIGDGRTVWDLLDDERSRRAIEVGEAFARGDASRDELDNANAAAKAASVDTRIAAWAPFSAAARAAWDAAKAAWAADREPAVNAASWAARTTDRAAWTAVDAAANATPLSAAVSEADRDAARATARKWQADNVRAMVTPFCK